MKIIKFIKTVFLLFLVFIPLAPIIFKLLENLERTFLLDPETGFVTLSASFILLLFLILVIYLFRKIYTAQNFSYEFKTLLKKGVLFVVLLWILSYVVFPWDIWTLNEFNYANISLPDVATPVSGEEFYPTAWRALIPWTMLSPWVLIQQWRCAEWGCMFHVFILPIITVCLALSYLALFGYLASREYSIRKRIGVLIIVWFCIFTSGAFIVYKDFVEDYNLMNRTISALQQLSGASAFPQGVTIKTTFAHEGASVTPRIITSWGEWRGNRGDFEFSFTQPEGIYGTLTFFKGKNPRDPYSIQDGNQKIECEPNYFQGNPENYRKEKVRESLWRCLDYGLRVENNRTDETVYTLTYYGFLDDDRRLLLILQANDVSFADRMLELFDFYQR